MTAVERLEKVGITPQTKYHDYAYLYNTVLGVIKEHAREKCAEQREICANRLLNEGNFISTIIISSPEPNFD
jgi:hypothetical protein